MPYKIQVTAATSYAVAMSSFYACKTTFFLFADTCRCPKSLSSAKIILPPLVTHKSLEILPALLDQAITSCCGNCSSTHGITKVNWEKDSRNSSSVKYSRQEALDAIVAGTNLALPIFRDSLEIEGDVDSSEYIMVPLIDSRQLAIFKRNPTKKELGNAAATIIRRSLWEQYPIFVISTVMTLLAAILFWLFVSKKATYLLCAESQLIKQRLTSINKKESE